MDWGTIETVLSKIAAFHNCIRLWIVTNQGHQSKLEENFICSANGNGNGPRKVVLKLSTRDLTITSDVLLTWDIFVNDVYLAGA